MKKRIVITGMGVISPIGDTKEDFYNNLIAGKSGITKLKTIDSSKIVSKIGGDIGDYDYKSRIKNFQGKIPEEVFVRLRKISKTAPFSTRLTMIAAIDAWIDSGLFDSKIDPYRIATLIAGHNFHDKYIEDNILQFIKEPEYIDALMGIVVFDSDIAASICETLQNKGPMYTVGGTCASAGIAIRNAIMEMNYNDCDVALVGGGVLDFSSVGYQALTLIRAISHQKYNDEPEKASRPFDIDREGFVPSHGTGMLVIETLEHAQKRGAKIYGEILAVDTCNDANHLSNPSVEGQVRVMKGVLNKAGIKPEMIDYINAHATSTPLGDRIEISSIKEVFGKHAYNLKLNATKSMIGHTGWTAHTVELIGSIMQMNNGKLHPSINIDNQDPEVDLDICANKSSPHEINYFIKNSFGFGGINCATLVKKFDK